jgi:hypothetical protein
MSQDKAPSEDRPDTPETNTPETGVAEEHAEGNAPEVQNASAKQIQQFVTSIKNPQLQVGEHVIAALQHEDTVAVLTSVVVGPGGQQHIVSAALDPQQAAVVNQLLQGAVQQREEETLCVGFHCLVKPKNKKAEKAGDA